MSRIEYRRATTQDLEALTELWWLMQSSHDAYCPVFYKTSGAEESKTICHRYFADLLKQQSCMIYVATSSDAVVGMIEITVDHDNPARRAYQEAGFCLRQDKMVKWL